MQRRNFVNRAVIGTATGAATLAAAGGVRADGRRRDRPTFVFVHGAWHGGWCWSEVVRLLAERGYPAIALDLPGHGITARLPQAYLQQPQSPSALATEVSPLASLTLNDYRDHTLKMLRGLVDDPGSASSLPFPESIRRWRRPSSRAGCAPRPRPWTSAAGPWSQAAARPVLSSPHPASG